MFRRKTLFGEIQKLLSPVNLVILTSVVIAFIVFVLPVLPVILQKLPKKFIPGGKAEKYFNKIYVALHKNKCNEGDTTFIDDLRDGGGGDTIRLCGKPSDRSHDNIWKIASFEDKCASDYETVHQWQHNKHGKYVDIGAADLRRGAGGKTIRLCYKFQSPGADGIKFTRSKIQDKKCDEGWKSMQGREAGHDIMDGVGHKTSFMNVCTRDR